MVNIAVAGCIGFVALGFAVHKFSLTKSRRSETHLERDATGINMSKKLQASAHQHSKPGVVIMPRTPNGTLYKEDSDPIEPEAEEECPSVWSEVPNQIQAEVGFLRWRDKLPKHQLYKYELKFGFDLSKVDLPSYLTFLRDENARRTKERKENGRYEGYVYELLRWRNKRECNELADCYWKGSRKYGNCFVGNGTLLAKRNIVMSRTDTKSERNQDEDQAEAENDQAEAKAQKKKVKGTKSKFQAAARASQAAWKVSRQKSRFEAEQRDVAKAAQREHRQAEAQPEQATFQSTPEMRSGAWASAGLASATLAVTMQLLM